MGRYTDDAGRSLHFRTIVGRTLGSSIEHGTLRQGVGSLFRETASFAAFGQETP